MGTLSLSLQSTIGIVIPFTCTISKHDQHTWILDSGATDHIVFSLSLFTSYTKIASIIARLSNGQQILATHSGTVKLNEALILNNIFYMPIFTINLVSVAKLASSLNCTFIFCVDKCLIQDNT